MKSPLLVSAHVSAFFFLCLFVYFTYSCYIQLPTITNETLEILTNREIIAINQDPAFGTSVTPFRWGINVSHQ